MYNLNTQNPIQLTQLFVLDHEKTAIGERTYGAGCGYLNGGIRFQLPNTGLDVRVPDCVRVRANGENEVVGIEPNIKINMKEIEEPFFLKNLIDTVFNSSNI